MIGIYIDESGTLGVKQGERYFVIAALITKDEASFKRIRHLVKSTKAGFTSPTKRKELKASTLTTPQKQRFLNNLSSSKDFSIAYLVADKQNLEPKLFAQKNLTFNYLFGVLLKSFINSLKDDLDISVDNRTVKVTSLNSLMEYVNIEAYAKWDFKNNLEIALKDSKSSNLLQAVDVVSNAIWAKYNYGKDHLYNINSKRYIRTQHFPYKNFGT